MISNFQVLARLMAALHFLWPVVLNLFAFTNYDNAPFLNNCLGKGYLKFFSTEMHYCAYDNPYKVCICWVWISILAIGNSKFQINTSTRIKVYLIKMRLGDSPLLKISILGRKSNENKAIGLVTIKSETSDCAA